MKSRREMEESGRKRMVRNMERCILCRRESVSEED